MLRRDLLRWGGYLAAAAVVGCRPTGSPDASRGPLPKTPASSRPVEPAPARDLGGPRFAAGDGRTPEPYDSPDDHAGSEQAAQDEPTVPEDPQASSEEPEASAQASEERVDAGERAQDAPSEGEVAAADEEGSDDPQSDPGAHPIARVEVICRDALGLTAASSATRAHTITRLTLHHTGIGLGSNAMAPERLRGHQAYHQQQGWADIAYHYGVDLKGNLYELRATGSVGETFTEYDPTGHLLVVCEGDYDTQHPPDAMLSGVANIMAHGVREHGAAASTLSGHRDHASISCPGSNLYARIPELRSQIERSVAGEVEHQPICGPEGRTRITAIEAG